MPRLGRRLAGRSLPSSLPALFPSPTSRARWACPLLPLLQPMHLLSETARMHANRLHRRRARAFDVNNHGTAGKGGALTRKQLLNQAAPRNSCRLAANRLHGDAKGTTSNESFHRSLKRFMKNGKGTRTFELVSSMLILCVWEYNGAHHVARTSSLLFSPPRPSLA